MWGVVAVAEYLRVWWTPRFEGPTRADRMGGWYHPYSADPLAGWDPSIPGSLAASISEAEEAIRELNRSDPRRSSLGGLGRFLLRAESVGSSAIEGLRVGPRRLLAAEEQNARGWAVNDTVAGEVLGNINAMQRATDLGTQNRPLTQDDILEVHNLLMDRSPNPELGGVLREEQIWIGGSSFNPCNASYVPPPPDRVSELMTDLMAYVNTDHHSPLTQAAIAHAQFETIHPFGDGNGRTGRALIHIVLQKRRVAPRFVPPISLVLSTWSDSYITALTDYRHEGPADSVRRSQAIQPWLETFTAATQRACHDALEYNHRINQLTTEWNQKLGRYRKGSALDRLVHALPGAPLLTLEHATQLGGRSPVATRTAITQLLQAGILVLRPTSTPRNRILETPDIIELFTSLERTLATPRGNTQQEPPVRPVPHRPPPRPTKQTTDSASNTSNDDDQ